ATWRIRGHDSPRLASGQGVACTSAAASELMDVARWERIQALFHEVADLARPAQRALLEAECPEDPALMEEVLALLEEDARSDSLLARDAAYVAGQVLEEGIPTALLDSLFGLYRMQRLLGP